MPDRQSALAHSLQTTRMKLKTLQTLVADRLEHLAERVETLTDEGDHDTAELLREEGLALASAYDDEDLFLFVDLSAVME